jgi:hypothetical protein
MLFETYVVNGNSKEAVEAIQQNGLITFNFYKEHYRSNNQNEVNVNYNFPPKPQKPYNPAGKRYKTTNSGYYGSYNCSTSGMSGTSGCSGTLGTSGTSGTSGFSGIPHNQDYWFPSTSTGSANFNSTFTSSCSTFDSFDFGPESTIMNRSLSNSYNPLETGMIEKGGVSNQQLKMVNLQFNSTPFNSISYKIMPYSAMNRTVGEIRQYCECGYRLRKETWKFCPHCGDSIN